MMTWATALPRLRSRWERSPDQVAVTVLARSGRNAWIVFCHVNSAATRLRYAPTWLLGIATTRVDGMTCFNRAASVVGCSANAYEATWWRVAICAARAPKAPQAGAVELGYSEPEDVSTRPSVISTMAPTALASRLSNSAN